VANKIGPGDTFSAVINGKKKKLLVVGVALSPEYIFQMRAGDFFPDDKRFAICWMARRTLEYAFDLRGSFNDIAISLSPGADEQEVIRQLDTLTEPYGGTGAHGRDEQLSHNFVSDELDNLKNISKIAPNIFLGVAAFLLNVVLARLVQAQREQIAALKAFGYSNLAVGWHYFKLALCILAAGLFFGIIVGILQGQWMTSLYQQFYRFPFLHFVYDPGVFLQVTMITLGAGLIGAAVSVFRAIRLPPAEAMRPPAPAQYRPTIVERLGLADLLSPAARMVLRHLERKPISASLSIIGLAFASAVMIMGFFLGDTFDYIVDVQFGMRQRENVSISFVEPRPARTIHELNNLPGVIASEPFRTIPVRLRHGPRSKRLAINGLPSEQRLHRILDDQLHPVTLPDDGLVVGDKLAEMLDLHEGEFVTVEVLEGQRPTKDLIVSAVVPEFLGANAYMRNEALNRFLQEGNTINGGYLIADELQRPDLYAALKNRPAVAAAQVREAIIQNFQDIQAENMRIIRTFYIAFGVVISVGVVYNAAQIALAERTRELASLRVLGFTRGEISAILLGELAVLVLASIPVGAGLGYCLAWTIAQLVNSEAIRLPVVISSSTFAIAASVILIAATIAALLVRRKLDHLDLVAVLKTEY
jgi:putative ABC transport system permease protein